MASSNKGNNFLSQLNLGESYTSLFLGAVVVVVALILVFSFLRGQNVDNNQETTSTETQNEQRATVGSTYTVREGDDLWHISETAYGSGYNWVDIVEANDLTNPSKLDVGSKLNIPDVPVRKPESETEMAMTPEPEQPTSTITGVSYTVVEGDNLWDIAVRAYGDGFKWVEIANANNLSNPDLIYPGDVFKLPR